MKIGGKEINVEKFIFFTNLISFIVSILFYMRMFREFDKKDATPVPVISTQSSEIRDSILKIDAVLKMQIGELKLKQDSILSELKASKEKLSSQKAVIKAVQKQIHSTIESDWDKLDKQEQEKYTNDLLLNIKKSPS